jgi:hypothetical protein
MKNMAFKVIDRLFLVVFGAANPTDEEWVDYLKVTQKHGIDRTMQLIFTDGGGPTSTQRKYLNDILDGRTVPVAVISGSASIRAVVTALSWFNRKIKAFPPAGLGDALVYLEIPATRAELIEREAQKLRLTLGDDERATA